MGSTQNFGANPIPHTKLPQVPYNAKKKSKIWKILPIAYCLLPIAYCPAALRGRRRLTRRQAVAWGRCPRAWVRAHGVVAGS